MHITYPGRIVPGRREGRSGGRSGQPPFIQAFHGSDWNGTVLSEMLELVDVRDVSEFSCPVTGSDIVSQ